MTRLQLSRLHRHVARLSKPLEAMRAGMVLALLVHRANVACEMAGLHEGAVAVRADVVLGFLVD